MDRLKSSSRKHGDRKFLFLLIGLSVFSIISIIFYLTILILPDPSERNVSFDIHSILIPDYQPTGPEIEYPVMDLSLIKEVLLDTFRGEEEAVLVGFFEDIVIEMQTPIATITLQPEVQEEEEKIENGDDGRPTRTEVLTETPEGTTTLTQTLQPSGTTVPSKTPTPSPPTTTATIFYYPPTETATAHPTRQASKPPTSTKTATATATSSSTPTSTNTATATHTHTPTATSTATATNAFAPTTDPNPDSNLTIDVDIPDDDCISVEVIVTISNIGERTTATNIIVVADDLENYSFVETHLPITLDFGALSPGETAVQTFTLNFKSNWASQPQGTRVRVIGTITNEDSRPSFNEGKDEVGTTRHPGGCTTP